ncbi:E3 ubiquitin-protein ligase RSL1-like [Impatiens glandulifera]|uniref:E3 ubiquitin-protein ligase RSL1-like n=1 Tax=Impatiens glandulifera TaxID=253017 RepID=UPI001FB10E06|nr:E3 ubiquitin-protein ligase RSL1-like [Impatiens glandulifera]
MWRSSSSSCLICLEKKPNSDFFKIEGCSHRYCLTCMKKHIEVKLLRGILPKCPHANCKSDLKFDRCKVFLSHKLIEIMIQLLIEASIPVSEKVYCPFPKCSALMSKSIGVEIVDSGGRRCVKCEELFCIDCKVPWHEGIICSEYRIRNPDPPVDELKLIALADYNLWRRCKKCSSMIELDDGCYHMTCRCGYEFCYVCGAEWMITGPSCSCPLWVEQN